MSASAFFCFSSSKSVGILKLYPAVKFLAKGHLFSKIKNTIKRKIGFNQEGLYQSEEYFNNIKDVIKKEFTLKNPLGNEAGASEKEMNNSLFPISLHIRRGDYVKNKIVREILGTLPLEYYKQAINFVTKNIKNPTFFIFSDDIEWAKENLKTSLPTVFVSKQGIKDYEELILMSKCKHNIIANSSFSWWGAWLNQNSDKIVIAPKQWFVDKTVDEANILPEGWVAL